MHLYLRAGTALFLPAFALAATGVGCSAATPAGDVDNTNSDVIIGESDFVDVGASPNKVPERYKSLFGAIGRMSNGCTATHLGNGIAVTAAHCFMIEAATIENVTPCRDDKDLLVEWGVRTTHPADVIGKCTSVIIAEHTRERDYAFFRVDHAPSQAVKVKLHAPASVGQTLTMFSHPKRRPLEWSQLCTFGLAEEQPNMFTHDCDAESGSSGAALIDDETLAIVGIHKGAHARNPKLVPPPPFLNEGTQIVRTEAAHVLGIDR